MYNSAGRERVVANKANFLSNKGHLVTIITTDQNKRPYYYSIEKNVRQVDLDINYFSYAGKNIVEKIFSYKKKNKLFEAKFCEFLESNPQDVVVTLEERLVPVLLKHNKKIVLIAENHFNKFADDQIGMSAHRSSVQRIVYRMRRSFFTKFYLSKLDAYVVLTEEDKELWNNELPNLYAIPNSIDYDEQLLANLDSNIAIAVGRLSYQKGFERLIEAWKMIADRHRQWKLHIYGNGENEMALKSQVKDNNLEDCISIYPATPSIKEKLLASSIFVLSSRFEGLPMVLLEAMSYGKSIVSYNCKTGPKDLITNNNGLLVQEGNIVELANKIELLIENESLRKELGKNAKISAKNYTHETIMNRWMELFINLKENKYEQ